MIQIDYSEGIKISVGNLRGIFKPEQLPLKIEIKRVISKEIAWTTNLDNNMWASYPSNEINDVVVKDAQGNFIYQYYWDVLEHGSIFYKSLWLYCKSIINEGRKPVGLVIGTHDGEFGEWVPLARNFMSDMLLVEGSSKQFNKLVANYQNKSGVDILFDLITPDGSDVEFFEGGAGYTNSVVKRVIDHWETEEVHSTKRTSTSINDLIKSRFTSFNRKLDWLHLDVEGLDAKLLMAIENDLLPNFVIFEDFNLIPEEKSELMDILLSKGYSSRSEGGICMIRR